MLFIKFSFVLLSLYVLYKLAHVLLSLHALYKVCMCSVKFAMPLRSSVVLDILAKFGDFSRAFAFSLSKSRVFC